MLQITSPINCLPLKPSVNFAKRNEDKESQNTEFDFDDDTKEEITAKKLEEFAEMAGSKGPGAGKTLSIITALTLASGLTAAALGGRGFVFANDLIPKLSIIERKLYSGFNNLSQKIGKAALEKKSGFKASILKTADKAMTSIKKYSEHNVEKELKAIAQEESAAIKALKKKIILGLKQENSEIVYTKKSMAEALKKAMKNNEEYSELLNSFNKERDLLKGTNLLKKSVKISAGTVAGAGALKESTADRNNDNIPDCVQRRNSHKSATKQVTAAIIECALDSCS